MLINTSCSVVVAIFSWSSPSSLQVFFWDTTHFQVANMFKNTEPIFPLNNSKIGFIHHDLAAIIIFGIRLLFHVSSSNIFMVNQPHALNTIINVKIKKGLPALHPSQHLVIVGANKTKFLCPKLRWRTTIQAHSCWFMTHCCDHDWQYSTYNKIIDPDSPYCTYADDNITMLYVNSV